MNEFSEWPLEAEIEWLTDDGEWTHYAQVRTAEYGEAWIAERADPTRWRVVARPARTRYNSITNDEGAPNQDG